MRERAERSSESLAATGTERRVGHHQRGAPNQPRRNSRGRCLARESYAVAMDWIFQANHLIDDEVAQRSEDWWNTPHHRDMIAIGDRVWLQVSGRWSPGLYYVATVVRPVYESLERDDPERPMFGHWRTDIRYEYRIEPPLLRRKLLDDPQLREFSPFRGFQGSNKPLPDPIASRLLGLAKLDPLER
jgi:hypothetical protein